MPTPHPSPTPAPPATLASPRTAAKGDWLIDALPGVASNFAQIYFVPSASAGLLLFAVLALADLPAAITGLAASIAASCLAVALRLPHALRRNGLLGYNATLTGIAFGTLWQPGATYVAWLAVCIYLTVIATAALARRSLPALTGPFVGAMALTWAMQPWLHWLPRARALACDLGTPGFVFCSVGQVVFVAPLALGLLTWYVLALWSPRATLWALAAGVTVWSGLAASTALWPTAAEQASGVGINAFLAALGLGMFGRRPAVRFAGALVAGGICVALGAALGPLGWPYFTLPFNLAVWILLSTAPQPQREQSISA
ncbi:urea transporter [Pandoraea terrigena]|uniref:Urea transporter n=1 Tax=Pandoraea terrigena TaxID=2508292 RepID=A0A5E4U799_9BURK|nr:urea transporter [Pandoraea terrigena]VVD94784.1 Urea transporter [Pandoraea terrigena]